MHAWLRPWRRALQGALRWGRADPNPNPVPVPGGGPAALTELTAGALVARGAEAPAREEAGPSMQTGVPAGSWRETDAPHHRRTHSQCVRMRVRVCVCVCVPFSQLLPWYPGGQTHPPGLMHSPPLLHGGEQRAEPQGKNELGPGY